MYDDGVRKQELAKEISTSIMLVAIVVAFLICNILVSGRRKQYAGKGSVQTFLVEKWELNVFVKFTRKLEVMLNLMPNFRVHDFFT